MTRHLDFDAIENFRDFGGYGAGGGTLVSGRLYRSGHHAHATDADLAKLQALGLAAIVDLRQPNEREREPSRRWEGFAAEVIENDLGVGGYDWVKDLHGSPLTAEALVGDTMRHYRINVFEPRLVDLFGRFLRAVADADGAVVIHCAAGKDRTGLACAFLHQIAGVHHDDMVADYLLTNDESRIARKMALSGAFVEGVLGRRPSDEALRAWVQVYPEFLDAAFDEIRQRCGSMDRYFEEVLGVDPGLRERLRARVLG